MTALLKKDIRGFWMLEVKKNRRECFYFFSKNIFLVLYCKSFHHIKLLFGTGAQCQPAFAEWVCWDLWLLWCF